MYRNKLVVGTTFMTALLLAILVLMLPVPASWQLPASVFYVQLIAYAILACLHVGAAILFTINLGVYKARLRNAYIAIAAGIIITTIGTLQVPVIGALDAWQSTWVRNSGLVAPFLLSSLTLYLATQYLTRLIKVKHVLAMAWIVIPLTFAISTLGFLLPHVDTSISIVAYDIALGSIAWSSLLVLCASILVFAIRRHVGAHYTRAMNWLTISLFNSFLILAIQFVYTLIATDGTGVLAQVSTVLAIASGFLWLRAGYAFALTKEYEEDVPLLRSLFGGPRATAFDRPKTAVDMVTYAAGLVSNSDDIDPMLDKLRSITAKLQPGETSSSEDTRSLVDTYLKIEQYLATKEVIRKFTQKEVRGQLDPNLQKLITVYEGRRNT